MSGVIHIWGQKFQTPGLVSGILNSRLPLVHYVPSLSSFISHNYVKTFTKVTETHWRTSYIISFERKYNQKVLRIFSYPFRMSYTSFMHVCIWRHTSYSNSLWSSLYLRCVYLFLKPFFKIPITFFSYNLQFLCWARIKYLQTDVMHFPKL